MDTKKCSKCGVEKALCEFSKNKRCKDGHSTICKSCFGNYYSAEKARDYYHRNKKRIAERRRLARQKPENKEKARERKRNYVRERRQSDPSYKVGSVVSCAVRRAIKKQGSTKGGRTFSALPYTTSDLVEHLEKQFDEKMTWDNYGDYWEVDHIYPQSLLPYDSLDHPNFQKCWALDNLQPLEKSENQRKSNKVLDA